MQKYDLIIIGAGPAGLVAGIFASRRGLKTLILSKDLGGQAATTPEIENYPALGLIEGWELMKKFEKQALQFEADIVYEEAESIKADGDDFIVQSARRQFMAEALILAFGKTPSDLGVPGEKELKGKHIHYAAMRDASNYKGKVVAMVGGGNTASEGAIMLAGVAKTVYLFARDAHLRCEKILLDRLLALDKKVEIIYNTNVKSFHGNDEIEKMIVTVNGKDTEFAVDDCFIGVGYSNKTDWVKELVATDKLGQIIIQPDCSTSTPGIFGAGDVTTIPYKQVVISAGEGAKAAIAAHNYISKKNGRVVASIDWGTKRPKAE